MISAGGVSRLSQRNYICTKDGSAQIDICKHKAFLLHVQKAILLSLEDKKLISSHRREQCEQILERQQR